MGEIDTKPIEPVQVALSLFGQKSDSTSSDLDGERERDVGSMEKDLANHKLQLEARDSIHKQLLLELEHYKKTAEGLAILLKNSEFEREKQIHECNNAKNQVDELELKIKQMADQLLETADLRVQLSRVFDELNVTQSELLDSQTDLTATKEAESKAMTMVELLESAADMEKKKLEELLCQISGLHDSLLTANMKISELEREKQEILAKKQAEMEIVTATAIQAQEQLEDSKLQLEIVIELESQLLEKSVQIETLKAEIKQARDTLSVTEDSTSGVQEELNIVKEDLERQEKMNSEQASYIEVLETELQQVRLEMENANDDVGRLSGIIETLSADLVKALRELQEAKERENEAQDQLALLKAELHKGRSKVATAEAAEAILQHEVETKYTVEAKESESNVVVDEIKGSAEDNDAVHETTSTDEGSETQALKKELEAAAAKIAEFRTRAEQAITRAEAAEKAKFGLEEQIRKLQEQKQRRKAALAALREESAPRHFNPPYEKFPTKYQPLGKVLNMRL